MTNDKQQSEQSDPDIIDIALETFWCLTRENTGNRLLADEAIQLRKQERAAISPRPDCIPGLDEATVNMEKLVQVCKKAKPTNTISFTIEGEGPLTLETVLEAARAYAAMPQAPQLIPETHNNTAVKKCHERHSLPTEVYVMRNPMDASLCVFEGNTYQASSGMALKYTTAQSIFDVAQVRAILKAISSEGWWGIGNKPEALVKILDEHKVAVDKAIAILDAQPAAKPECDHIYGNMAEHPRKCTRCGADEMTVAHTAGIADINAAIAKKVDATKEQPAAKLSDAPAALKYFKPPFMYDAEGQTIWGIHNGKGKAMCLQVRGWGNLIGGGANALDHKLAAKIQDEFGQWVCDVMNGAVS